MEQQITNRTPLLWAVWYQGTSRISISTVPRLAIATGDATLTAKSRQPVNTSPRDRASERRVDAEVAFSAEK